MTDNLTPAQRNKNMRAIKSSHTKMEDQICHALWNKGLRFRRNVKELPGKPDIAIKNAKLLFFLTPAFGINVLNILKNLNPILCTGNPKSKIM